MSSATDTVSWSYGVWSEELRCGCGETLSGDPHVWRSRDYREKMDGSCAPTVPFMKCRQCSQRTWGAATGYRGRYAVFVFAQGFNLISTPSPRYKSPGAEARVIGHYLSMPGMPRHMAIIGDLTAVIDYYTQMTVGLVPRGLADDLATDCSSEGDGMGGTAVYFRGWRPVGYVTSG